MSDDTRRDAEIWRIEGKYALNEGEHEAVEGGSRGGRTRLHRVLCARWLPGYLILVEYC